MRLHEEYYVRHSLEIPCIKYEKSACLILQANNSFKSSSKDSKGHFWQVVSIGYKPENNHPGNYELSIRIPAHNSSNGIGNDGSGRGFFDCLPWKQIQNFTFTWDDYEDSVNKWSLDQAMSNMSPIVDDKERSVVLWNLFSFCSDYKLQTMPVELTATAMHESLLVYDNTFDEKLLAIKKVENYLQHNDTESFEKLRRLRSAFSNEHYASWLGKLILHHRTSKESHLAGFNKELALD